MKIKRKKSRNERKEIKEKSDKKKILNTILVILSILGIGVASLVLVFALYIIISSPDFDQELLYSQESTVMYDVNNNEIARIGSENRVLVTYDELPQVLIDALIATEDSRFFQHNGLDGARFLVASVKQAFGDNSAGGASTVSMQVIKNTYTGKEANGIKGIIRKFTDIYMAVFKLESKYTKEEIIEFYFNSQWLGYDGNLNYSGIYGVEQASQYYFGKTVSDLTLAEASMLVGMFQNPYYYNPYKNPEVTTKRRSTVLKLMVKHGYITEEERISAEEISVESLLQEKNSTTTTPYQAFIDYVIDEVEQDTGINPVKTPMAIYTTLDPNVQKHITDIENGNTYKWVDEKLQMGLAITSVKDGSIVGLSGGRDYAAKGLNRATDINNQPGSTAKILFDYAPYIEYLNGSTYSMFLDESYTYSNGTKITNADNKYRGLQTMRQALSASRNIPALQAFQAVSALDQNLISDFVHSLGINYGDDLYESASIGGFNGTNPLEMSAAYGAFARGGYYIKPYGYTKAIDLANEKEYENKYTKDKVMSEETAYMITSILETAQNNGVGGKIKVSGTDIAAKGGTTNLDSKAEKDKGLPGGVTPDHWNITYSPDYTIALWVGYDSVTKDYYLTSNKGGTIRKNIMGTLGTKIYKKNSKFTKPKGVVSIEVEKETFPAQLPSENTPANMRITELFKKGTEPTEVSTRYSKLNTPKNGNYTFDGSNIRLTWDAIDIPDAINTTKLQNHFNEYYYNHASNYYQKRISYNNNNIGSLGYQIYLKDANGNLQSLGFTNNNSFNYQSSASTENYTFVIKSAYSIFKSNMSDALTINVSVKIDTNIEDIITPDNNSTTNQEENNSSINSTPNSSTTDSTISDTTDNTIEPN